MDNRTSIAELATRLRAEYDTKHYGVDNLATKFEASLDLKNALDDLERACYEDLAESQARQLIIYEYALYDVNKSDSVQPSQLEGIRTHPFLSHWVEVIRRARLRSQQDPHNTTHSQGISMRQANDKTALSEIWKATQIRCTIVTMILTGDHTFLETLAGLSLDDLFEDSEQWIGWPLDLQPYLDMLLQEDVYTREDTLVPLPFPGLEDLRPTSNVVGSVQPSTNKTYETRQDRDTKTIVPNANDILNILTHTPQAAWSLLTNLQIDIPVLELLNKLFSNDKFTAQLDAADLASTIIQNALRSLELPEATDSQNTPHRHPHLLDSNTSRSLQNTSLDHHESTPQSKKILDRGERIRVVKLLVLFIKHIIRTGIASPGILLYEIQEITTRYAWVGEVRELQSWVQGGDLLDDALGGKGEGADGGGFGEGRGRSVRDRGLGG